jgi:hypothetical protein
MSRLYHSEYLTDEYSRLEVAFFVQSLMTDSASNSLIPFDTSLRTMLDEIMMWCVTEHLPEDLVRFLLSLLPELNFKVTKQNEIIFIEFISFSFYLPKHFYVSMVLLLNLLSMNRFPKSVIFHNDLFISVYNYFPPI